MKPPIQSPKSEGIRSPGRPEATRGRAGANDRLALSRRLAASGATYVGSGKDPIYLGSPACGKCHDAGHGHQFSKWRLTAHARPTPLVAAGSGRNHQAQRHHRGAHRGKMCLGCHATASEGGTGSGVRSFPSRGRPPMRSFHGPGSEYAVREIMMNKNEPWPTAEDT